MIYNRPEYWLKKKAETREACLTFSSPSSFTLAVNDAAKHWDGTLEYSTDKKKWSTWDGATILSSITSAGNNVLYLSGTGNTTITGQYVNFKWTLTGTDVACIGNIETLLDYKTVEAGEHPTMADYCYGNLFVDCTSLTHAPDLPATTLTSGCYSYMFSGCTSLTQAPALPATTLADRCYGYMFEGCTSLTQAPALPATTLADYCYYYMFRNCSSLTTIPALPATRLADYCYSYMFNNALKISSKKTTEYAVAYRIPKRGTGVDGHLNSLKNMFGTTSTPKINTTYYLSKTISVIG